MPQGTTWMCCRQALSFLNTEVNGLRKKQEYDLGLIEVNGNFVIDFHRAPQPMQCKQES